MIDCCLRYGAFVKEAKATVRAKPRPVNSVFLVQLRKTFAADFAQDRRGKKSGRESG
jgi:hypothetical protein